MKDRTERVRCDGRITVITFSFNEAALLSDCLMRLTDFDELLVCNMQSSDDTVAVANRFGARIIDVPIVPIAESVRQLALDAVRTEWALMVDADEHLPDGFREALKLPDIPDDIAAVGLFYRQFGIWRHAHSHASQQREVLPFAGGPGSLRTGWKSTRPTGLRRESNGRSSNYPRDSTFQL